MRIFLVTFVLACAAFWMLADFVSGNGGAVQVADTAPAPGATATADINSDDMKNDAFQPVIDERNMTSTQIRALRAAAKKNAARRKQEMAAEEEQTKRLWQGVPENVKNDFIESRKRLESDHCDRAAAKKFRAALVALAKIHNLPLDPQSTGLMDEKTVEVMCGSSD